MRAPCALLTKPPPSLSLFIYPFLSSSLLLVPFSVLHCHTMACLALFALFRFALPTVNTPRFLFSPSSPSFLPLYIHVHVHIQRNTHAPQCTRSVAAYIRICTPACTWILCKRNVHRVKRRGKLHTEEAPTHALPPTDRRNPLHFVSTLYADHSASLSSLGSFLLLPPFSRILLLDT